MINLKVVCKCSKSSVVEIEDSDMEQILKDETGEIRTKCPHCGKSLKIEINLSIGVYILDSKLYTAKSFIK